MAARPISRENWRPPPEQHVERTRLSAVYRSAVEPGLERRGVNPGDDARTGSRVFGRRGGVVPNRQGLFSICRATAIDLPVLIDMREGDRQGLVLQHPLYDELDDTAELEQFRVPKDRVYPQVESTDDYRDVFASHSAGERFDKRWLAAQRPVVVRGRDTGWVVMVQESYDHAIGGAVEELRSAFLSTGLIDSGRRGDRDWLLCGPLSFADCPRPRRRRVRRANGAQPRRRIVRGQTAS